MGSEHSQSEASSLNEGFIGGNPVILCTFAFASALLWFCGFALACLGKEKQDFAI